MPKVKGAEGFRQVAREDDETAITGLDAQGEEREDAQLEDGAERIAPNLDNDNDETEELDRVRGKRDGKPPVFADPRDAIAKAYDARKRTGEDDAEGKSDGDVEVLDRNGVPIPPEAEDEDADPEVVILGRDGKPVNPQKSAITEDTTREPMRNGVGEESDAATGASGDDDEISPDRMVTMLVDGKKIKLPFKDMQALAQINSAAEARLREANNIVDRARSGSGDRIQEDRSHSGRDQGSEDDGHQGQSTRGAPGQKVDRARLTEIVRTIQLGSEEEGADALGELIGVIGQTNADGDDVRSAVSEELAQRDARSEISDGLAKVQAEYTDVLGNKRLEQLAFIEAHQQAVGSLREIGVPEEDLRADAMSIFNGYAVLRQDPRYAGKLKPIGDIFSGAAEAIRTEFRTRPVTDTRREPAGGERGDGAPRIPGRADQPPRIVRSTVREERRSTVPSQPRSASLRSNLNGSAPPVRRSNADIVAEMRESRIAR